MTAARVGSDQDQSTSSNGFTSKTMDTTGANFIVILLSEGGSNGGTGVITDSKSNTWTKVAADTHSGRSSSIWYAFNATVGTGHTFSVSGTANFPSIAVAWYSGMLSTDPIDQTDIDNSDLDTTIDGLTLTPSLNDCLVIGGSSTAASLNAATVSGTGFSVVQTKTNTTFGSEQVTMVEAIQTTAGAATPVITPGEGSLQFVAGSLASFKADTGPPPPPDPFTVTAAGSLTSASSTTTLAGDCGAAFAVGDTIVVLISADNNGSNGASSLSSVSDASGNVYTLVQATFDPGAAAAGQTVGVGYARITTAMVTTDDVTVNFSPATVAKAAHIYKIHPDAGRDIEVVATGTTAGSTTGTPTVTTATVPLGAVVFACLAAESNATPTADSDTTNGSWSAQRNSAASASSSITSQYKIVTAVATQTYNPTITSCDNILGWIILNIRELWPPLLVPGAAVHRASRW